MTATCYVLEGTWGKKKEVPQVLPYLQAIATTHGRFHLVHRTIRTDEDIEYWLSDIPKNDHAFVYIACHGGGGTLEPSGSRSAVSFDQLCEALEKAKKGAVDFLHLGCCGLIGKGERRAQLQRLGSASRARWVSSYVNDVDWLQSTLLDMAIVAELYLPYHQDSRTQVPKLKWRAQEFFTRYEQLARSLGFSGLSRNMTGVNDGLFPRRLRRD